MSHNAPVNQLGRANTGRYNNISSCCCWPDGGLKGCHGSLISASAGGGAVKLLSTVPTVNCGSGKSIKGWDMAACLQTHLASGRKGMQ